MSQTTTNEYVAEMEQMREDFDDLADDTEFEIGETSEVIEETSEELITMGEREDYEYVEEFIENIAGYNIDPSEYLGPSDEVVAENYENEMNEQLGRMY